MGINKKKRTCRFSRAPSKNQRKRKERQTIGLCPRTKKTVEHEGDG